MGVNQWGESFSDLVAGVHCVLSIAGGAPCPPLPPHQVVFLQGLVEGMGAGIYRSVS